MRDGIADRLELAWRQTTPAMAGGSVDVCFSRVLSIYRDLSRDAPYRDADGRFAGGDDTGCNLCLKGVGIWQTALWWLAAGLLAGACVMVRPDSGLFAVGIGLTLVLSMFFKTGDGRGMARRFVNVLLKGAIFSAAFCIVLVPWTVRNESVFGIFQPLSPAHGEAPGEFVQYGYYRWLRTWIDDSRYIGPMLWGLGQKRIKIDDLPASAFASDEERGRVAVLIDAYNDSDPDHPLAKPTPTSTPASDDNDDNNKDDSDDSTDSDDKSDDSSDDTPDQNRRRAGPQDHARN